MSFYFTSFKRAIRELKNGKQLENDASTVQVQPWCFFHHGCNNKNSALQSGNTVSNTDKYTSKVLQNKINKYIKIKKYKNIVFTKLSTATFIITLFQDFYIYRLICFYFIYFEIYYFSKN